MKVRIKRNTKAGDQVDYSLATGPMYGHINDDAYPSKDPFIKDTISAVPKSDANIEAEGGETLLGDINNDGMLEHSKIRGKRHYEGGVPLNVPDGSFLFSDTKKLKIKEPAILDYFGKKLRKGGSTPASIAKQYDLNKYNEILKDPKSSRIEKETAQRMIAANTQKLSELALIQESMKGMPNGVPSFVESVMGEPAQAQYGGMIKSDKSLPKYQDAGSFVEGWIKDYKQKFIENRNDRQKYQQLLKQRGTLTDELLFDIFDYRNDKIINGVNTETFDPNLPFNYIDEVQEPNKNPSLIPPVNIVPPKINALDPNYTVENNSSNNNSLGNSGSNVNTPDYYQFGNPDFKSKFDELNNQKRLILPKQSFDKFGVQHRMGNTGLYGREDYDWEDFKDRHGDWIDLEYEHGGFEGFLRDIKDPKTSNIATRWYQKGVNKQYKEATGLEFFTPENGSPYGVDGEFGMVSFSVPRVIKKEDVESDVSLENPEIVIQNPPVKNQPEKEKLNKALPFNAKLRARDDRWYIQDSLNLANALGDNVNTYMPTRQQVDMVAPDATYLDPSRQVAAIQEQASRYQDLAMNTADGQIARANALGNSGQSAAQVADVLANYENQNVQIANQNAAQRADVENRERLTNVELDSRYNQELATVNQNRDNALRELRQRRLMAFNQGVTNNQKKKMLEQVLYPQVSVDSITGDWFTTNGRNIQDVIDTYVNPAFGGTSGGNPLANSAAFAKQMVDMKNQFINDGMSAEDAKWAATQMSRTVKPNYETSDAMFRNQLFNSYFGS